MAIPWDRIGVERHPVMELPRGTCDDKMTDRTDTFDEGGCET